MKLAAKRRLSVSGRSAPPDRAPGEDMQDVDQDKMDVEDIHMMLNDLNLRLKSQSERLTQIEGVTTRNVVTIRPWQHGNPRTFWNDFDELMGVDGSAGMEQVQSGDIISVNDAFKSKCEIVYFRASRVMEHVSVLRSEAQRRGLALNITPFVPQSRKAIKSLPQAAFRIVEKALYEADMDVSSCLKSDLPEGMCPSWQHRIDVNGESEDKWPAIATGRLERIGQTDAMIVNLRTKFTYTEGDQVKTWDLQVLIPEINKLTNIPGYGYLVDVQTSEAEIETLNMEKEIQHFREVSAPAGKGNGHQRAEEGAHDQQDKGKGKGKGKAGKGKTGGKAGKVKKGDKKGGKYGKKGWNSTYPWWESW